MLVTQLKILRIFASILYKNKELNKMDLVRQYGEEIVNQWRRSYHIAPPKIFPDDLRNPIHDKRYKDVDPSLLPCTENLSDVLDRVTRFYET